MFSKYNTPSWQLMHQQCLLQQMFPIWRKKKNECLIIIFYIWTCVWCFTVYKALSVYTSTQPILETTVGGRQDTYYIIFQQFVLAHFCHAVSCLCDSHMLFLSPGTPSSPSSVSSFHLANSQSTLKIDTIATFFFKSPGILHSEWDVSLLHVCTICSVAMITIYWTRLLACLSLSLGCVLTHLIAWVSSYWLDTVPVLW